MSDHIDSGPESTLRDVILNGVSADILRAERSYKLAERIGTHADAVNVAGFGPLFGPLQEILSEHQTLNITKIFERHSTRNRVRSIPVAPHLLESHATDWSIPQRFVLEDLLSKHGAAREAVRRLTGAEITRAAVKHFRDTLPSVERIENCRLSASLDALRAARDKAIAHNEAETDATRRRATWGEAAALVSYAKIFVGVIGFAYLSIAFEAGDEFLLSYDAGIPARALQRLLQQVGIAPSQSVT